MRPVQIQYVDDEHKKFAVFCNSLRCPLCGSQLDGVIKKNQANLYCVSNNEEYKVEWAVDKEFPNYEQITYFYSQWQYVIRIGTRPNNDFHTRIERYNMDAHPSQRWKTRKTIFEHSGARLMVFRKRMEENEFLKKLKLYNVFS